VVKNGKIFQECEIMTRLQKKTAWIVGAIILIVALAVAAFKGITVYEYRLQGEDIQKYEECLKRYQEDVEKFRTRASEIIDKNVKVDEVHYSYYDTVDEFAEEIEKTMYSYIRDWPEKYRELFFYTLFSYKYQQKEYLRVFPKRVTLYKLNRIGRPIEKKDYDEIYASFNKWDDIWDDLNEKLENKYYVPEDLEKYKKEMQELLGEEKLPEYIRVA